MHVGEFNRMLNLLRNAPAGAPDLDRLVASAVGYENTSIVDVEGKCWLSRTGEVSVDPPAFTTDLSLALSLEPKTLADNVRVELNLHRSFSGTVSATITERVYNKSGQNYHANTHQAREHHSLPLVICSVMLMYLAANKLVVVKPIEEYDPRDDEEDVL